MKTRLEAGLDLMAYIINLRSWEAEAEAGGSLSSTSALNRVSSPTARATRENPVSKNKAKKKLKGNGLGYKPLPPFSFQVRILPLPPRIWRV